MEYDLDPDKILIWATDYASYEELEQTAKALYGVYVIWRKRSYPEQHAKAKMQRRQVRVANKSHKLDKQ